LKPLTRFIFENWPWKLLSLGGAALLWMAVASEPEMATYIRVPVVYKNAPQNLEISSTIETSVRVQVTGVSGHLREASLQPLPVVLDLSSVRGPGVRTFNVDSGNVRLPRGVEFLNSVPAQLHFTFENRLAKDVPVLIQWSGILARGKQMAGAQANPAMMTIEGPASHVNAVHSVSTDPIDLGHLRDGQVLTTSPFIDEPLVRFHNFHTVQVRVILKNGGAG
jgi:YbbR domain-containing protein